MPSLPAQVSDQHYKSSWQGDGRSNMWVFISSLQQQPFPISVLYLLLCTLFPILFHRSKITHASEILFFASCPEMCVFYLTRVTWRTFSTISQVSCHSKGYFVSDTHEASRHGNVWDSGDTGPLVPDLATRWLRVVSFTPRPRFTPSPPYPLDMMLGGPQSRFGPKN